MKVWITEGEYRRVPGRPRTVHATEASADAEAAELVNIMLEGEGLGNRASADNWRAALELLRSDVDDDDDDGHPYFDGDDGSDDDGDECWVEVTEHEVQGIVDPTAETEVKP